MQTKQFRTGIEEMKELFACVSKINIKNSIEIEMRKFKRRIRL
jgi:hypothetical protein